MEVKVKATTMISTKTDDETKKMKDEEDQKIIKQQEEDSFKKILQNDKSCNKSEEKMKKEEEEKKENNKKKTSSREVVWDCGSSLYDSFELNSFKRQLDSAISASSARSMSMSRLPDRRIPPPPQTTSFTTSKKHSNKISRSLQRILKSVFRSKWHHSSTAPSSPTPTPTPTRRGHNDMDPYYVVFDKTGSLTTIPESTEKEVGPPQMNSLSLVRKTVSERFPAARVVGISCA